MAQPRRQGYYLLSEFMSWAPNAAIFPRFRSSNLLNLLLLQAEVCQLEDDLGYLVDIDQRSGQTRRVNTALDWTALNDLDEDHPTKKALRELRETLATYSECRRPESVPYTASRDTDQALVQQIALNQQPTPHPENLAMLRDWLKDQEGGKSELRGPGATTWSEVPDGGRSVEDLLRISSGAQERTVLHGFLRALWQLLRHLPRSIIKEESFRGRQSLNIVAQKYGSAETWAAVGDQISSFLAAMLILAPVIALHFISTPNARLGAIVGFTFAFVLLMVFTTQAKRNEVFAATAAFVAVQVIYVGAALNQNENDQ